MNKNIISDYLGALEHFSFAQVNELQRSIGKKLNLDLPAMCGEILKLRKHAKLRRFVTSDSDSKGSGGGTALGFLLLFLSLMCSGLLDIFLGHEHWKISMGGPIGVIICVVFLIGSYIERLKEKEERFQQLKYKLTHIIDALKAVQKYVKRTDQPMAFIAINTLNSKALEIVTMENALPVERTGLKWGSTEALDDVRREIRRIAAAFKDVGVSDGTLDCSFCWAEIQWKIRASKNLVGVDYVI